MSEESRSGRPDGTARWDNLFELRSLGIIVVTGFFFGAIAVTRISGAVENDSLDPVTIASFILLAATFVLLLLWGWSTQQELNMLKVVGGGHVPPIPGRSFPLVVGAAVALGSLGVATAWPAVFAAVYIALKVFEFFGQGGMARAIKAGLTKERTASPDDDHAAAIASLETYYLGRPWMALQLAGIVVGSFALACSVLAYSATDAGARSALALVAYGLLVLAIVVNETVVTAWRLRRTQQLPDKYR